MNTQNIPAWYFANAENRLNHDDNREIVVGETHEVELNRPMKCCHWGLHASIRLIDALNYADYGGNLYRVILSGEKDINDDKIAAQYRHYVWRIDAQEILQEFARKCALEVIHLWDAPDIVKRFLKTGDVDIAADAADAAYAAYAADAADAVYYAAYYAVYYAANAAAYDAADAAHRAANAVCYDTGASYDKTISRFDQMLTEMVMNKAKENGLLTDEEEIMK